MPGSRILADPTMKILDKTCWFGAGVHLVAIVLAGIGVAAEPDRAAEGRNLPAAVIPGQTAPSHAIAMHGAPELAPDFPRLPYADPSATKGGRLAIGFQGTFDSLNPFNLKAGSTAQGLVGNVFESLMTRSLDEPFTLYGLIARTIETDADRTYVTFRLDPRAHFSDGAKITASDVRFTFDLLKAKGRPQQRAAYSMVKSVDITDPATIRFDLSGSTDRELPLTLALMPVLPSHKVDPASFEETTLAAPIGSGPYKITGVVAGQRLVLSRDPSYWAQDLAVRRGLFNFDEIIIDYFRDANSMFEAFRVGLIDFRIETSPQRWVTGYDFPAIHEKRAFRETLPVGGPKGMEGFAFNTRRSLFQDVRVREALGLVLDFEWINANLYDGLLTRTKSFFDESELASTGRSASIAERKLLAEFPGVVREDILEGRWRPNTTDGSGQDREAPHRALELLREAGYVLVDGRLHKNDVPLDFEILVKDRNQERLALNYAQSLARIGVTARVRLVDEVQYQRRRQKFDFDMIVGLWLASASPGNEQRARWGSASADQDASFNLAGVKSPAVDAMIKALLAARSHDDFVAAVRAYDRVLLSGFYVVPLFHASQIWVAASSSLARPQSLPAYGTPLGSATLDTWWRRP
jgi:peptide/nickel transport system substrate-binding protein